MFLHLMKKGLIVGIGSRYDKIFCPAPPPSCVLCPMAEIFLGEGGGGRNVVCDSGSDENISAPLLKFESAPEHTSYLDLDLL